MIKFLIITGLIVILVLLIINSLKKAFQKFISGFVSNAGNNIRQTKQPAEEVLFSKDDIVVLKGEASASKDKITDIKGQL